MSGRSTTSAHLPCHILSLLSILILIHMNLIFTALKIHIHCFRRLTFCNYQLKKKPEGSRKMRRVNSNIVILPWLFNYLKQWFSHFWPQGPSLSTPIFKGPPVPIKMYDSRGFKSLMLFKDPTVFGEFWSFWFYWISVFLIHLHGVSCPGLDLKLGFLIFSGL